MLMFMLVAGVMLVRVRVFMSMSVGMLGFGVLVCGHGDNCFLYLLVLLGPLVNLPYSTPGARGWQVGVIKFLTGVLYFCAAAL
ncbi:MAG: hypothetical protein LBV80_11665 [Deltaproteobacteria bacterium]|nr:hypothetical protein [Deltaproteobacteria bacterium]